MVPPLKFPQWEMPDAKGDQFADAMPDVIIEEALDYKEYFISEEAVDAADE